MVSSERLIADVVGVVIEKILMEISVTAHSKMVKILGNCNMTFSDCYRQPDVFNHALKEIFGNDYLSAVQKIRNELMGVDEDHRIDVFIALVSE